MSNGFTGDNGGDNLPPIEVPDFVAQGKMEESGKQSAQPAGYWTRYVGGLAWAVLEGILTGIMMAYDLVLTGIAKVSAVAQSDSHGAFWLLSQAVIGELLGVEPEGDINAPMPPREWRPEHMRRIGGILWKQFEEEFGESGELSESQGLRAVTMFLGFLITFGVREGNVALLADLLPFDILKSFREIGVNVANNLGLGRLARMGLRPLIETTIATPLQWQLHSKYRPAVLGESLAIKANIRGHMSDDRMLRDLRRKGYTEEDIQTLLAENTPSLTLAQLYTQHRWGNIDEQAMLDKAKDLGYPVSIASLLVQDLDLARAENEVSAYISKIKALYVDGFLDHDSFVLALRDTPLTQVEQQFILKTVALDIEYPSRRVSYTQLKAAYVAGIVDLDYVQFWLQAEHYDPDSQTYLLYEILLASDKAAAKEAAAKLKHSKNPTASSTPPQTP